MSCSFTGGANVSQCDGLEHRTPLQLLRDALAGRGHEQTQARMRRSCRVVVDAFLRGSGHTSIASLLGVTVHYVEDSIRWYMNHPPKKRAKRRGRR